MYKALLESIWTCGLRLRDTAKKSDISKYSIKKNY